MSHWLTTSLLACYSLLSLLCNVQAQDSTASVRRVNAKFEVTLSDGNPFVGTVTLKDSSNDVVYLYTNRFGLGFAQLRPDSEYSVSIDGFPQFSHFGTVPISQGVMEIELVLPPAALKGISAKEGYGLVLFSYLNVMGHPVANRLLYCKSEDGELYTGITNAAGKARVEVPLGHTYQFSVDGTPNFDSHTFTSYPPLQTAEIKLELNKTTVIKHSILPRVPDNASDKAKEAPSNKKKSTPVYRTHKDSIRGAKKRINPPRAQKNPPSFAIPSREEAATTPYVSKQVLEGVYMLRQAIQDEERQNRYFVRRSRLHLLQTLQRKEYDSAVYVVDVTCSMDPYIEEYLLWLSLANNAQKVYGGVFFNDGDGRADSTKVAGSTGGVHLVPRQMEEITEALVNAISYGCSGDDPENDLEALLFAENEYPQAKQLILIADNNSAVRDIELLPLLTKPVHVILCSLEPLNDANPPNEDYVNIAIATHGSISTLNEDLRLLKEDLTSDRIAVGRWHYQKLKNRFVRTTPQ